VNAQLVLRLTSRRVLVRKALRLCWRVRWGGSLRSRSAFEIPSSDGYVRTRLVSRYKSLPNLWVSWARKKFLVVERCGLAAVCGVVGLLNPIIVFVALSGDVDEICSGESGCGSMQGMMA
jgi:hypothetical protein